MPDDGSTNLPVGIVVIGRNEGERLVACLNSVIRSDGPVAYPVVYVDSGSRDDSVQIARKMGAVVVELDNTSAFTAARARNRGFQALVATSPFLQLVQFVDGDCEVDPSWVSTAISFLTEHSKVAVVCGRRRERYPNASIYNRLCDLEWNTPVGQANECGGDAMMRIDAFTAVGGYNNSMIAGEEPELCVRLRLADWTIHRIAAEMTLHDAAMTHFSQWWNRNVRAGHAFAEGSSLHGDTPLRHWVKQTRSNWIWGCGVPLSAILLAWPTRGVSIIGWLALLCVLIVKIALNGIRKGDSVADTLLLAPFTVIGKFPQAMGQIRFRVTRLSGRRSRLIEYKNTTLPVGPIEEMGIS